MDFLHSKLRAKLRVLKFKEQSQSEIDFSAPARKMKFTTDRSSDFSILIIGEQILILREKSLSKFSSNLYDLRPPESEKVVFMKVSVCL